MNWAQGTGPPAKGVCAPRGPRESTSREKWEQAKKPGRGCGEGRIETKKDGKKRRSRGCRQKGPMESEKEKKVSATPAKQGGSGSRGDYKPRKKKVK